MPLNLTTHQSAPTPLAYEMFRETGVVKLPSQRTLRDYTYIAKASAGFSRDVDAHILHEARLESRP